MQIRLQKLQKISLKIYDFYSRGFLTQDEYLTLIKPLDKETLELEYQLFKSHPQDTFVFEKSSLKRSH